MDHARRREELGRRMRNRGLDAFLVINVERSDRPNLRYLTGFTGSFGILIAGKDRSSPPTPATRSRRGGRSQASRGRGQGAVASLARRAAEGARGRKGWDRCPEDEPSRVPGAHAACVRDRVRSQTGLVEELRRVKSEEEIARISAAARLTDEGLRWVVGRLAPGQKERDVALDLEVWYRRHGAEGVAFDLIVAGGPGSAMPHHRPTDRAIARGDVVLFDIGAQVNGYCADLTRVVAVGTPVGRSARSTALFWRQTGPAWLRCRPGGRGRTWTRRPGM